MGKRRRRSFNNEYRPKRRREKSPFKFLEYIHNSSNKLRLNHHNSGDNLIKFFLKPFNKKKQLLRIWNPSELQKVENTLENVKLDNSDIKWVIQSLTSEIDNQLEEVCSIITKHDFFRRSDVFGNVVESINSDQPDIEDWLKHLVKLVVLVSKQSDIKTEYTKTILRVFSSLLLPTKCSNDPLIKDEIENAFENLKVRERYEDLQDDSPSKIQVSGPLRERLHTLITWPILPTSEMVDKDEHPPLWPRDLRAPYRGPVHYLIEQFSLFLEDFIAPLRRGIKNYMNYVRSQGMQSRFKDENIRVYKRVRLLDNKCIHGSGVCLEVQFDTNTMKRVRWDSCNFLQYGNVVCLTYDDCPELFYALIANRDVQQLKDGRIFLKVLNENSQSLGRLRWMQESRLVMIESKSFFMVYNRTLESFQTMALRMLENNENIPFAKYLVDLNTDVREPLYTRKKNYESTRVDFNCLVKIKKSISKKYKKIPILNVEKWPTREEMGLNEDQYEALKKCLTRKIGILQGPPGTGKTWMGVRIVEFLLSNFRKLFTSEEQRPILLLSYTNHALDQFFEKLLELESIQRMLADLSPLKPFVRVGGRCENEQVKEYSLNVHRKKIRCWSGNRAEMRNSLKSVKFIDTLLGFLQEGIVSVDFLVSEEIISPDHYSSLIQVQSVYPPNNANDSLLAWLEVFENGVAHKHTNETPTTNKTEIIVDDLFLQETERRILDDDDKSKVDEMEILNDIYSLFLLSSIHSLPNHLLDNIQSNHTAILNFVRKMLSNPSDCMSVEMVMGVDDVWDLSHEDRWRLYKFWNRDISLKFLDRRNGLVKLFDDYSKTVENERFEQDLAILTSCYMVGMTTTGAATNMNLLRKIKPRIVVVEEAAQVHEQHIIGCLTKKLQHLILIGDHQQLRPAMNNYDLKRSHKTDVSLMERLVMNKFPFHCLTYQHRMRPEISRMLTPAIYPTLQNHPTVLSYQNIKGVKHNIFFFNHQNVENQTEFSTSYTNDFEADMIAQLYKYLILQGYSNADITILSAYNDQVRKIRRKVTDISKEIKVSERRLEHRVHITAVDNFQGEENRIILLSLVRSNAECKLGHLGDPLRICVSLSRAKEGLYVIGNFEKIDNRKNLLWMEIIKTAKEIGVIGDSMSLVCQNHPETITKVSTPQDFEKVQDGGCTELCATQLQCGHVCERRCHGDDSIHNLLCQKPCLKIVCERNHLCPKKCHEKCGKCMTKVKKTFESCEHEVEVPCFVDPASTPCPVKCTKTRSCGHPCTLNCGQSCDKLPCTERCLKILCDSGHPCPKKCHEECGKCMTKVMKKFDSCGHEVKVPCYLDPASISCPVKCTRTRQCGHPCTLKCGQSCDQVLCMETCLKIVCDSKHPCPKKCHEDCRKCLKMVTKKYSNCGHENEIPCCMDPASIPCKVQCTRKLECGHPCTLKCGQSCDDDLCKVMINNMHPLCRHITNIKCYKKDEYICRKQCTEILECGHVCQGDCHVCSNGRLHVPCKEKCSRKLACGHTCSDFCWNPCPPCSKRCKRGCVHKRNGCSHLCKNMCEPCEDMSNWICYDECENKFRGSEKCHRDYNRPPCNKRCKKSLICKANHRCIGLCGENCPSICKRCDKDKLRNYLGAKSIDDSLFVQLIDCGHIFEVKTMDEYMGLHPKKCIFDEQVALKKCVQCSKPIRSSGRYKNVINQIYSDIVEVNRKCEVETNNLFFKSHEIQSNFLDKDMPLKERSACCRNRNVRAVCKKVLKKLSRRYEEILAMDEQCTIGDVTNTYNVIFDWIFLHSRVIFAHEELEQLNDEVERFSMYTDLMLLKHVSENILPQTEKDRIQYHLLRIRCPDGDTFNRGDIVSAQSVFDEIRKRHGISCLWMPDRERRISFKGVVSGKRGNWYKCSKGHIYLNEVGGSVDDPRCPDCLSPKGDIPPPTEEEMEVG